MNDDPRQEFKNKAWPLLDELYGAAIRMTRNPSVAEDLVAESFARAWKSIDQFQPGTNIRAWMYRILTNAYISHFRREKGEPEKVSMDAYEGVDQFHLFHTVSPRASSGPDPVKEVVARLTNEDFRRAMDELPEEYRAAVVLFDLQGLSYQEVADALGVPVGTVRSRLARGRGRLQESLRHHAVDWGAAP